MAPGYLGREAIGIGLLLRITSVLCVNTVHSHARLQVIGGWLLKCPLRRGIVEA
jgi:hypothetical protein